MFGRSYAIIQELEFSVVVLGVLKALRDLADLRLVGGAKLGHLSKGDEIGDHVLHPVALFACVLGLFNVGTDLKVVGSSEDDLT